MLNKNTSREQKIKALKLAQFIDEDKSNNEECVSDMKKFAHLNDESANVVANALRNKYIESAAAEKGLEKLAFQEFDPSMEDDSNAQGFAKKQKDDNMGMNGKGTFGDPSNGGGMGVGDDDDVSAQGLPDMDSGSDDSSSFGNAGMNNEGSEQSLMSDKDTDTDIDPDAKTGDTVKFEIEVPSDQAADFHAALEKLMGQGSDDQDDDQDDSDDSVDHGNGVADDSDDGDSDDADKSDREASTRSNTMIKEASELADRKAKRKALAALASNLRVAAERDDDDDDKPKDIGLGRDTSSGGSAFQHAKDAQPQNEDRYETFTMENSGGNSLKGQNPSYTKVKIPTKNPDNLQLRDAYEIIDKEGSGSSSLQLDVDFKKLNDIPSANPDRAENYAVPTEMSDVVGRRKTTVANQDGKRVACAGCNNPEKIPVHTVQCNDCRNRIAICEICEDEANCPYCAGQTGTKTAQTEDEATTAKSDEDQKSRRVDEKGITKGEPNQFEGTDTPNTGGNGKSLDKLEKEIKASNAIEKARIKVAYSWSARLAAYNIIQEDEMDELANQWLASGLAVQAMNTTGNLMMRSAKNSAERVASVASNGMQRGTRNNPSLSNNITVASTTGNDAVASLKETLQGFFTTPENQYTEDKFRESKRGYMNDRQR